MERTERREDYRRPLSSLTTSTLGDLSSSRTRITAPIRDRHGEPLGKTTIKYGLTDQLSTTGLYDTATRFSATTSGIENGCFSGKTLSGEINSSELYFFRGDATKVPYRVEPRATKSVLYDTVDQKLYRERRKMDPVQLYHQYQAFWKANPVPGGNPHRELRWNIRAKLMQKDYEVAFHSQTRRALTPESDFDPAGSFFDVQRRSSVALSEPSSEEDRVVERPDSNDWTPPPPSSARHNAVRKLHRLVYN